MKTKTTFYLEIPFGIPCAFIAEYRDAFEELYGAQPHLSDFSIICFGLEHFHYLDEFTPAYFDFFDDSAKETRSFVLEPGEWPLFFGPELDPFSPIEELEAVFQFRFDLSFLAMRELVQREKRYNWRQYDAIMERIGSDQAIHFLQGIKMMVLRDGGKVINRDIHSFTYIDKNQANWIIQYHTRGQWIRRFKYDPELDEAIFEMSS